MRVGPANGYGFHGRCCDGGCLLTPLGMVRGRKRSDGIARSDWASGPSDWLYSLRGWSLLEMGMLLAVWMVEPETLPEPATLFCVGAPWYAVSGLIRVVWLTRMVVAVPVFAVFSLGCAGHPPQAGGRSRGGGSQCRSGVALVGVDAHLHGALPVIARDGTALARGNAFAAGGDLRR